MSKKSRFRVPLDKQHGKPAETLLKSARQYSYQIYWLIEGNWVGKILSSKYPKS